MVVDESGEGLPVPDTGICFPSSDGFKIHMDFSVVWGVLPDQAPDMIRRFGNLDGRGAEDHRPAVREHLPQQRFPHGGGRTAGGRQRGRSSRKTSTRPSRRC